MALAFTDDFTSDPRTNPNWDVQNDEGLFFDNPGITLTSNRSSFPYLKSSNTNDFSINKYHEITFQYLESNSPWGVGASFTDNAPNFPTYLGSVYDYLQYNVAYFFGNYLHAVSTICPNSSTTCPNTWWFIYPNDPDTNSYLPTTARDFSTHTFSVTREDIPSNFYIYSIYLDDIIISQTAPTSRLISSIWIGHPSILDSPKQWPTLKITSVRSLPTKPMSFPYLSQKDQLWENKEYDSASEWAGIDKGGIGRWGCAITSTTMMLQYYGVKTDDGKLMNPDFLNTWLKGQPDGYVGPGLMNWLAVARYAKGKVPGDKDSLEYTRSYDLAETVLPAVLGLPGHFVVAHDEDTLNWVINDPADVSITTLAKTSVIRSVNSFVPSSTDLSYMMFVAQQGLNISLLDGNETIIPLTWVSEYLDDDEGDLTSPVVLTSMLRQPEDGKYKLRVDNPTASTNEIEVYLYDKDGAVAKNILVIPQLTSANFVIHYTSAPDTSPQISLDYTNIFDYLRSLRTTKSPANGIYQAIYDKFGELTRNTTTQLEASKFIAKQSPKHINAATKSVLQNYIMLIEEN